MHDTTSRTALKLSLSHLLNDMPGRQDYLFWHLLDTAGYSRPADRLMVVEPYSDGSAFRCLVQGVEQLTLPNGDENAVDNLCALLSRLFGDTDPALATFLETYLAESGRPEWSAPEWLTALRDVLARLSPPSHVTALRHKWSESDTHRTPLGERWALDPSAS